nr:reverse transcriptase domain-containing protein [Tanacetum cinerariifolium]
MMASFFQMNTASTLGSGSLPSNTISNPKGELKAITTRSGTILDGPSILIPPLFINPEEDERVEETLTDQDLAEYTIKVPPPLVQKSKPPSQRDFFVHQRDPLHLNIHYPSRMLKQKQQEKDECKALADLGASINLMPLFVWKKLGLSELISTRMTLDLANQAICTPARISRDVFVLVGKFTFPADFVIVDYESDPRVPLIFGRPFLRTTHALSDVHGEEMILRDGDKRLTLNMRHDTSSYSNQPQKESINLINVFNDSSKDFLEDLFSTNQLSGNPTFSSRTILTSSEVKDNIFDPEGGNVLPEKFLDLDSTKDLHSLHHVNLLSGSTTSSSSPNQLLEEFADELALITFPLEYDDELQFDIEFDLKEIEYLLHHDPIKDIDSILKDSINQSNLVDLNDNLVDSMPEMFTDEHAFDYSSPPLYDEYDDDLFEVKSDTKNVYDDPFDSNGKKIKEFKLLIDELDLLCDFLLPSEYDSFLSKDFSKVDALPLTDNEDKVFNPCILIQENLFEIITRVAQDKKLAISHASLMIEDFDPPLDELPFFKEVPRSKIILLFLSENEEKVFKPWIHTSEIVNSSLIKELSHQGYKVFKINQILKSPMKIFLFSCGKDTCILDVLCLYFYPIDSLPDEFAGELILLKSILSRIDETDCDLEEEFWLIEKLLYDNSSPHLPKGFIYENSDAAIESFSPFPIPVEDSDSFMEEIDLSFTPDDPMPTGIEEDDYDYERDMLIFEELLSNDSLSLPENENGAHDGYNCPSHVPFIQTLPSFPQQYPCCEDCGGPHKTFQCQPMNYFESNLCYDSNYSGSDQIEPSQYSVNPSLNIQNELRHHELFINELIQQKLQNKYAQPFLAIAITFDLPTVEPEDSLRTRDEHLDTIPEMKSDEFIKSSVENLVPSPSESEDDNISKEIYSNPLFDEEINSMKIDPHHFNTESDLIESLLNHDSLIIFSSSKIDSLLDEFAGELILLKSIPLGIDETDCDLKEEIHPIDKLLYDNSSSRSPEEFISKNSDAAIESFSPSPIPVQDSDSLMEEIDLSLTLDDSMLLGIENDDYDSEVDMLILEELLSNNSLSLVENESFHFDIPPSLRPPAKPSDDDEIKTNSRILTVKVVGDIFEHNVPMPRLLPTQPTLASNWEKTPHLLSHRGLKAFQLPSKIPMMIYGGNTPIVGLPFLHFYPP